jgi:hypothetical protein
MNDIPATAVLAKSPLESVATTIAANFADAAQPVQGVAGIDLGALIEMLADIIKQLMALFGGICGPALKLSPSALADGTAFAKFAANPSFDAQVRMRELVQEQLQGRGLAGRIAAWRIGRKLASFAAQNPQPTAEVYRYVTRPDFGLF